MRSWSEYSFLLALILIVGVLTILLVRPFLSPLALGIIFAVVLQPLYLHVLKLCGGRASLAAFATVLLSLIVLIVPLYLLGTRLFLEAQGLYATMNATDFGDMQSAWIEHAQNVLNQYVPGSGSFLQELNFNLAVYAREAIAWLLQHSIVAFTGIASFLLQSFIFVMTLYYLLRDGDKLKRFLIEVSPLRDSDDTMIFDRLGAAVNSVVKGKLLIALIQGFLAGIGFAIFGVPSPVLWGFLAAIASLVPPLGTGFVVLPIVLYMLAVGDAYGAIGLTLWGFLGVGVIDNMLGPKLIGRGMQLHPLLVLFAVLGGLAFFGPIGLFLGPLTVSFLVALLSLYRHFTQGETV